MLRTADVREFLIPNCHPSPTLPLQCSKYHVSEIHWELSCKINFKCGVQNSHHALGIGLYACMLALDW